MMIIMKQFSLVGLFGLVLLLHASSPQIISANASEITVPRVENRLTRAYEKALSHETNTASLPSYCHAEGSHYYNETIDVCVCKDGWITAAFFRRNLNLNVNTRLDSVSTRSLLSQRRSYCSVYLGDTIDSPWVITTDDDEDSGSVTLYEDETTPGLPPSHCHPEGTKYYNETIDVCVCKDGWITVAFLRRNLKTNTNARLRSVSTSSLVRQRRNYCSVFIGDKIDTPWVNTTNDGQGSETFDGFFASDEARIALNIIVILIAVGLTLTCCCIYRRRHRQDDPDDSNYQRGSCARCCAPILSFCCCCCYSQDTYTDQKYDSDVDVDIEMEFKSEHLSGQKKQDAPQSARNRKQGSSPTQKECHSISDLD